MNDIKDNKDYPRSSFEQILMKIPGFKGYLDKEYRREADQVLRVYIWKRLEEAKSALGRVISVMTDSGRIKELSPTKDLFNMLEKSANRIRFASHGYSGFYDLVRITDSHLDKLYDFDRDLLNLTEDIFDSINSIDSKSLGSDELKEKFSHLSDMLGKLDLTLNERDNVLTSINKIKQE